MKHVSFLGAGSWGTALAILCANNGHQVTIWSKVKAETDMLKEHREHLERLPGVKLPDSIVIEEDLEKASGCYCMVSRFSVCPFNGTGSKAFY